MISSSSLSVSLQSTFLSLHSEWNCVSPKVHVYLEPVNGTLFGNRVFADVIKLRRNHIRFEWFLNPATGILIRIGRIGITEIWKRQKHRVNNHVSIEAGIEVMLPQTNECLEPPEKARNNSLLES